MTTAPVIAVVGASGGIGTTTLAGALAIRHAAESGMATIVDGSPHGGLDIWFGAELTPGPRWSDLSGLRGTVDPMVLVDRLPTACGVRVMSNGRPSGNSWSPGPPDPERRAVLAALREVSTLVIVDGGRYDPAAWWLTAYKQPVCRLHVLLVGASSHSLACGPLARRSLPDSDVVLALSGRRASDELGALLGESVDEDVVAIIRPERRIGRHLRIGRPPRIDPHGSLGRAAGDILSELDELTAEEFP